MNPTLKRYVLSSVTTFLTVGSAVLAMQLSNPAGIEWTSTFWLTVILTVARAGFKAVIESIAKQNADQLVN